MIELKDFLVYFILSLLTISGISLYADDNFAKFIKNDAIPSFTTSVSKEFGKYNKILNSTHCVEKVVNAGGEIEVITSSSSFKIFYKLPNVTYGLDINDNNTINFIQTKDIYCEKIDNPFGMILKVKSKFGSYEIGIVNGSSYEKSDGKIGKLDDEMRRCENLIERTAKKIINIVFNTSSCLTLSK